MDNVITSMYVGFDINLVDTITAMDLTLLNNEGEKLEFTELRDVPKDARDNIIQAVLSAMDKFIIDCKALDVENTPFAEKS